MYRPLKRASVLAGVLSAVLLLPSAALAQEGGIQGTVRDASGGVLPGVTVEVTSPALIERVRATVTEGNGQYRLLALPVGTYDVRFILPSFNTVRREGIVVTTGFTATVNADMRPGDLTEEVTVVAEAPTVDVTQARQSTVFSGEDLRDLPTSRNLSSLMVLVPGINYQTGVLNQAGGVCVGGAGTWCTPNIQGFNAHGPGNAEDRAQGQLRVDGMVLNSGSSPATGNLGGYIVDVTNAQEVSFNLSGALGESETGGASINIVPRTGGNTYRGTYSTTYTANRWFDRNDRTRSGAGSNNIISDHDVSGSFGGPILRDRLWFHTVLRTQGKEAFPGGQPFYYNRNAGIWAANYQPDRERGVLTYANTWRNANARVTLQATQRNKFNLFWDEQEACQDPCDGAVSSTWSPEANWSVRVFPNRVQQVSWTNPFTNRVLLEGGLSVVSQHYDFSRHKYEPSFPNLPQISEAPSGGCCVGRDEVALQVHQAIGPFHPGTFGNGGCFFSGTLCSGSIGQANLDRIGNARPRLSASYITGSHNAKVGWDMQYFWQKQDVLVNTPQLLYRMTSPAANCYNAAQPELSTCGTPHEMFASADPFNSERRPVPVSFLMNAGPRNYDERLTTQAFYVQDQWTVNRFTLNGALRYDHASSRYNPTCLNANQFVAEGWCTEPNDGVSFHNLTPRWGVAWDVFGDGKTAVKWNMGQYLSAARFSGVYSDFNLGRRVFTSLPRNWTDTNGNRMIDCDLSNPAAQDLTATGGDVCGAANALNFARFGTSPYALDEQGLSQGITTIYCGQAEAAQVAGTEAYCNAAGQNVFEGWNKRRSEWQFGLGIQREIIPRLSAEVTYNQRWFQNNLVSDTLGLGCDFYTGETEACQAAMQNFQSDQYSFYRVQAPVDPRLPDGGGYWVTGLNNRATFDPLPSVPNVFTLQTYSNGWKGVDTNFVLRARGGLRFNGGTSTGASFSNTCSIMNDGPGGVRRREGNDPSCATNAPFQTNIRGSVSYTIPFVDVLASAVFQSRPGPQLVANMTYRVSPVVDGPEPLLQWEAGSEWRAGNEETCPAGVPVGCFMGSGLQTVTVNLLDQGDLYGARYNLVDLKLGKNIRFARRRVNIGVDIYNLFNSDAIVNYNNTYNPQSWSDESGDHFQNVWRSASGLIAPRFARFAVQFDF